VVFAVDLVEDGAELDLAITADVLEAVSPGGDVRAGVEDGGAVLTEEGAVAGQRDDIGVNLGREEVVKAAAWALDGAVGRCLSDQAV